MNYYRVTSQGVGGFYTITLYLLVGGGWVDLLQRQCLGAVWLQKSELCGKFKQKFGRFCANNAVIVREDTRFIKFLSKTM